MHALNKDFYDLLMETAGALYGAMRAIPVRPEDQIAPPALLQLRAGRAESPGWFLLQAAEFDPEPLTTTALRVRDIYASTSIVQALLDLMASGGYLVRRGQGNFYLSEVGRATLHRSGHRRAAMLETLAPLLPDDVARITERLGALIGASLTSPTPPGVWCLAHSRRRAPSGEAADLVRLAQYLDDCNAFRDDAHMAAWQPLGIEGYVWEAFALICDDEAESAAGVCERLAHRGYSVEDYFGALNSLTMRGWLEPAAGGIYRLTADGQAVRTHVEDLTDRYFYAPWSCLEPQEIVALDSLLTHLRDHLATLPG